MLRASVMLLALILGLPATAQAGILFEMRTTDFQTGEVDTSLGYTDQGFVKLGLDESAIRTGQRSDWRSRHGQRPDRPAIDNKGTEVIFRPQRGNRSAELILVDHDNRSYQVISENTLPYRRPSDRRDYDDNGQNDIFSLFSQALQNAGRNGDRQDDDRWDNDRRGGPPGYRGGPGNHNVIIRQTRRTEQTWFGPCVVWERLRRGIKTHEICTVDPSTVEYGPEIIRDTEPMAQFYDDIVARTGRDTRGVFFTLAGVQGFPVLTRTFDRNGAVISEREFIRAREARLGPQNFLPPRDYRNDRGY